ncbi:MAG: hypothetical protein J6X16_04770 [Bacteroidales bacterium]|jgi:hypothetical protein|nr:hypothetical protein [Bacteroidales bacterium]
MKKINFGFFLSISIVLCLIFTAFKTLDEKSDSNCSYYHLSQYEDGIQIADITMTSECRYALIIKEIDEPIKRYSGTYTMSEPLKRGSSCTITLFQDGEYLAQATLAWPIEDGVTLILGDYILR